MEFYEDFNNVMAERYRQIKGPYTLQGGTVPGARAQVGFSSGLQALVFSRSHVVDLDCLGWWACRLFC